MRVVRPILVAFSASAVAALVPLSGVASAVEEPPHRVAARDGDFEIRDYPALSVAEVTVRGGIQRAMPAFVNWRDYFRSERAQAEYQNDRTRHRSAR